MRAFPLFEERMEQAVIEETIAKKKDRRAPVQIGKRRMAVLTIDAVIEDADDD